MASGVRYFFLGGMDYYSGSPAINNSAVLGVHDTLRIINLQKKMNPVPSGILRG